MVYRIYSEKKHGLENEATALLQDARSFLGISSLQAVRLFNRYDVDRISPEVFEKARHTVFSEPQLDLVTDHLNSIPAKDYYSAKAEGGRLTEEDQALSGLSESECSVFAVEYLPGQYDQRADSAAQCIQILSEGDRPLVRTARVYKLYGKLSETELAAIKHYVINPVEAREASLDPVDTLDVKYEIPTEVKTLEGFIDLSEDALSALRDELSLAMDFDDIRFCQEYFRSEHRDPTITEIRMIDTYWSDHCRHTTFLTTIDKVSFADPELSAAWQRYMDTRSALNRTKPVNFMDIATLAAKYLRKEGKLEKLDESEEINACTVKIKVNVDGEDQDWLLLFKNETHNHPTEIEPFGGAATCIGGAIRDPLSGRSYVYHAMRVTGAADPTRSLSETLPGKLPQRKLVTTAAAGYSSYGNQIGLATGIVDELYHDGYAAKRMEIGAVVAAAPAENVRRERPLPGDVIILLGGRTGRDGCGGATGSSKAHNLHSIETCGAEVQKGNAPEERKLQRLFRDPKASRMIKRCNDFGAGGVSVAIGELADGLLINLDKVPKKYDGLDGTELAISESQERMAVVVAPEDAEAFMELAHRENLEATVVATVQEDPRLVMSWNGRNIVDISREFLNSNGAEKHIEIETEAPASIKKEVRGGFTENLKALSEDLNICSKKGLSERFDSTIGAGSILMPFGGRYQMTPIQAMAAKVSVEKGHTDDCSVMAWGYNPLIAEKDPYKGAYLAVVESVSKLVAEGAEFSDVYLTFQEYFKKPGHDGKRWSQPLCALLGAFSAQLDLEIAAIGGKDSMSGSFEKLDVPPTLVSFAITTEKAQNIISPEFKHTGSRVLWLRPKYLENGLPEIGSLKALYGTVHKAVCSGKLLSVYTPCMGGPAEAVMKQCFGNMIGFRFAESLSLEDIFGYAYGSFIVETDQPETADLIYHCDAVKEGGFEVRDLGTTNESGEISYNGESLSLNGLLKDYENRLEKVFSCNMSTERPAGEGTKEEAFVYEAKEWPKPLVKHAAPKVLIPAFPGTNCEYDSAKAVSDAGLDPKIMVIRNLSAEDIRESVDAVAKEIADSQIIFIPGGFSGGDEPDGSAKFITSFFRNERIREAVMKLLTQRDGLMCGICNGFQALIKLGLVPYGEIMDTDENCPTLTFNTIARHQSKIVRTRIASNKSPWLINTKPGEVYNVPISHGEGRFLASEELIRKLAENGQIATQYADLQGDPTMDIRYNPNGSICAVEGITSPDGRVFGKMGHAERIGDLLYRNVPGNYDIGMFRAAKTYFE